MCEESILSLGPTLYIHPKLIKTFGIKKAVFIQQMNDWIEKDKIGQMYQGRRWIKSTRNQWQEGFPFWSEATVRRYLIDLESKGVILSTDQLRKDHFDRSKCYTIDYDVLGLTLKGSN